MQVTLTHTAMEIVTENLKCDSTKQDISCEEQEGVWRQAGLKFREAECGADLTHPRKMALVHQKKQKEVMQAP